VKGEYGMPKLGNMFDSNFSSGKPLIFTVGEHSVIKGLEEGIMGMKAGGKRFIVIPSHMAYGDSDRNTAIPPNSTLCFQIEVVKVKPKTKVQEGNLPPPVLKDSPREEQPNLSVQQKLMKVGTPTIFNLVDPQPQTQMMQQMTPQTQQQQQMMTQQPQQMITQQYQTQQQQQQQQMITQPQQQMITQQYQPQQMMNQQNDYQIESLKKTSRTTYNYFTKERRNKHKVKQKSTSNDNA